MDRRPPSVVVVVVVATKVVLHRLSAIDQEVILGAPSYGWDVGYRLRGSIKNAKVTIQVIQKIP